MKVIFVCTGNSCRSPMAEYLLRDMLDSGENSKIEVDSAGIMAASGASASQNTITVLKEAGIESIEQHRTKSIEAITPAEDDLILAMTEKHKRYVQNMFGEKVRVYTLNEYIDSTVDMTDPHGRELERYRELFRELKPALSEVQEKLTEN